MKYAGAEKRVKKKKEGATRRGEEDKLEKEKRMKERERGKGTTKFR